MSTTGIATAPTNGAPPTITILEGLPDAIVLLESDGAIAYANAEAERLYGRQPADLLGVMYPSLLAEPFAASYAELLARLASGERIDLLGERREVVGLRQDGSTLPMELTLSEVAVGQAHSLAAVARDISDRKAAEARLQQMANKDGLTEFANRIGFERALTEDVVHSARYGGGGSVIAIGVDNFQYINESLGQEAGDELIVEVAELIHRRLRKTDILARVGGDTFGVLAHDTVLEKGVALAEELVEIARQKPFVIRGEGVRITMSAGVTALNGRSMVGGKLLAEAESAMHGAKAAGRDRVVGFDLNGEPDGDERRVWTERVRRATERGLFLLTSQPIVKLATGETTQHEVLLRMREDGGGLVEPASFLATAERYGLIGKIDRWVTQQAVRLIAAHNKEGRELILEVNLSAKTMGDARFPDEVSQELTSSGIDPSSLIFEVTETAALADIEHARAFARNLAKLGCRFALDDFGAGYGSFYYLKHLPISYLKIDGEFIRDLPESHTDQLIVRALVDVCSALGIKTIAEYVSDQERMDMVRELGVDFAQGYHLGRPEPVSALRALRAG